MEPVHTCGIIGVGLMGGSLGLALRARGVPVVGCDVDSHPLSQALAKHAVDRASTDLSILSDADWVVICTPPNAIVDAAAQAMPFLKSDCFLADFGSVKGPIVSGVEALLKPSVRFVGLHPMCGSAGQGVESARADLFEGAVLIATPTERTDPAALEQASVLARLLGMRLMQLTPEDHDRQIAIFSHLTYLVAVALTRLAPGFDCAGPAFREATRVAMSPSALWGEILTINRSPVLFAIEALRTELARLASLPGELLVEELEDARTLRTTWERLLQLRRSGEDTLPR